MANDWLVGDRHGAAAERIYAAATALIARDGLENFDMAELQATVHCSRATLYRHVGGFDEGSAVTEGQTLFEIQPDAYQAAITQIQGQIKAAEAAKKLADIQVDRQQQLVTDNVAA